MLSSEDGLDVRMTSPDLSDPITQSCPITLSCPITQPCPITVSDIKDIFMCSRSRQDRLNTLYRIRSELFTYDLLGIKNGYSSFIAEIDRAVGLLETSPVGTTDPEVLRRIDHIELSMLG